MPGEKIPYLPAEISIVPFTFKDGIGNLVLNEETGEKVFTHQTCKALYHSFLDPNLHPTKMRGLFREVLRHTKKYNHIETDVVKDWTEKNFEQVYRIFRK